MPDPGIFPLAITSCTAVSAMGRGRAAMLASLLEGRSGLRPCDFQDIALPTWIGRVAELENVRLPERLAAFEGRNHRLAWLGLETDGFAATVADAARRLGPERVAIVLGTSTSGILESELAYRHRDPVHGLLSADFSYAHSQDLAALPCFVQAALGLCGPAMVVSTACSSAAKAFGEAAELIAAGVCDAAVVGGVDSLCGMTLYGFAALELLAPGPCRPAAAGRDGISIGEAAAFALLERPTPGAVALQLLGVGGSSDASHMSAPHPDGTGAWLAMTAALASAGLAPAAIDYVNLHGTGTLANDAAEDRAVFRLFGGGTPCSSTKGWSGHTLGTAGALELVIAALCIETGLVPAALGACPVDPAFRCAVATAHRRRPVRRVLSNSFGFGGSNCSLVIGAGACG